MLLVIALALGAAGGGYLVTHQVRLHRAAADVPKRPQPPAVLSSATDLPSERASAPAAPQPQPAALAHALAGPVAAPALGSRLLAAVGDAAGGALLYRRLPTATAAPASTAKLLTAAAVLRVRPGTYRIATTVVAAAGGTVVLVGAGDPTLSGATGTQASAYADAARITDLAAQLRRAHVPARRVLVDGGLFTGPATSPRWAPEDVPSDYAAPITAVMSDGGRAAPRDEIRSPAPDLAAGRELAHALGLADTAVARGTAPPAARTLARVQSPPLTELVGQMLQASDNVIAECLARQVALALGRPASFSGAAAAVRTALARIGADPGAGMLDGSGLAAADRVSPAALVAVLQAVIGPDRPELHAIVTALPVAGWSGTLADRFVRGSAAAAAGSVRAKTGTLTSVSSLAGVVHDADGRLLVFALLADGVPPGTAGTEAAESALDQIAATLARCGCG